jgi:hypothetical protein
VAVVAAAMPKAFMMENVPGLEQMGVKQRSQIAALVSVAHGGFRNG